MSEAVAIIIVITVYVYAICSKLLSIENELNHIKHVELGTIKYLLKKIDERKEE